MIQNYVDKVYMINLASAKERLAEASDQCKKHGIEFERVNAIKGSSPKVINNGEENEGWNDNAAALAMTTVNIIKKAKKQKLKSIFIMEDDVKFVFNFNGIFRRAFNRLPEEWDFFHCNVFDEYPSEIYAPSLNKLNGAWCCQAYAISENVYDEYIKGIEEYNKPIDQVTMEIHNRRGKSFATRPNIVIHPAFKYSTLREDIVDY